MVVTEDNFHKICRLCLCEKKYVNVLKDDTLEKLKHFTSLQIDAADGLPKLICLLCESQVNTSYVFKTLCETSDIELRKFLLQKYGKQPQENEPHLTDADVAPTRTKDTDSSKHKTSRSTTQLRTVNLKGKRYCCVYCKRLVTHLPRHMLQHHSNEQEIKELRQYPTRSKARVDIITNLRKRGNFYYDIHLVNKGATPRSEQSAGLNVCVKCLGYYAKARFYKHVRNCNGVNKHLELQAANDNVSTTKPSASKALAKYVLPTIKTAAIVRELTSDPLLLMYGSELCNRKDIKTKLVRHRVRLKLREMTRLFICVKKLSPDVAQFVDIFDVRHFDALKAAVYDVAGFNVDIGRFSKQHVSALVAAGIRTCASIVVANAIVKGDDVLKTSAEDFLKLFDDDLNKLCHVIRKRKIKNVDGQGNLNGNTHEKVSNLNEDGNARATGIATVMKKSSSNIGGKHKQLMSVVLGQIINNIYENRLQGDKRSRPYEDCNSSSSSCSPTSSDDEAESLSENEGSSEDKTKKNTVRPEKRKFRRRVWMSAEVCAVRRHFFDMIQTGCLPSRQDVVKCMSEEPCLNRRTWQQIKAWISNQHRLLRNAKGDGNIIE